MLRKVKHNFFKSLTSPKPNITLDTVIASIGDRKEYSKQFKLR